MIKILYILTILQLILDGGFEIESFGQSCLVKSQSVSDATNFDTLRSHAYAQLGMFSYALFDYVGYECTEYIIIAFLIDICREYEYLRFLRITYRYVWETSRILWVCNSTGRRCKRGEAWSRRFVTQSRIFSKRVRKLLPELEDK